MLPKWQDPDTNDIETACSPNAVPCKSRKCKGGKTKKCAKHRTKIGAYVEKKLRKNMRAQITTLFEEHLGKTRETKTLIEAITNLCLAEKQKATDAQMRQMDALFNFLTIIQKEIDFIKKGQRR